MAEQIVVGVTNAVDSARIINNKLATASLKNSNDISVNVDPGTGDVTFAVTTQTVDAYTKAEADTKYQDTLTSANTYTDQSITNLVKTVDYPIQRPTLSLNFIGSKAIDPRITFTRNSVGTYFDSSGVMQTAAVNVPRIGYDPTTGECLGFLIEEQRTNLLLNSATLSTQSVSVSAVAYALSFYGTGTITLSGAYSGSLVGTGSSVRSTILFTAITGTLTLTVTGTCTNAQLEAGAFPTSYIPTTSAQVTRAADSVSITNVTPWYNQTEGSVLMEYIPMGSRSSPGYTLSFSENATNWIGLFRQTTVSPVEISAWANSSTSVGATVVNSSSYPYNIKHRASASFGGSNITVSVDGSSVVSSTVAPPNMPTVAKMEIFSLNNSSRSSGYIRFIYYYPKRLTDSKLQGVSALT